MSGNGEPIQLLPLHESIEAVVIALKDEPGSEQALIALGSAISSGKVPADRDKIRGNFERKAEQLGMSDHPIVALVARSLKAQDEAAEEGAGGPDESDGSA